MTPTVRRQAAWREPRIELRIITGPEDRLNTYPASEQNISEVERGRSSQAIVPIAEGKTVSPGDLVLFALATSQSGQEASYVKDGDWVCVLLTDVTDLGTTDPATGMPLFQLSWKPLGQPESPQSTTRRAGRSPCPAHPEVLMFPRYRHTPTFDTKRKRCSICGQPVYSLAGIHPQCAIKLPESSQHRDADASAPGVGPGPTGNPGNPETPVLLVPPAASRPAPDAPGLPPRVPSPRSARSTAPSRVKG